MSMLSTKVSEYLKANGKTFDAEINNFELKNLSDGNGDFIVSWNVSGLAQPTQSELDNLEDEANATEALGLVYQKRKSEYPSIADQLDNIYHNGIDAWKATIKTTKDKYPKG